MRSSVIDVRKIDVEMFFFGLAFLLLETKFVTTMNLVWGATWLTSAVVFGSVLLVLFISTIVMQLRPLPWWTAAMCLLISLLITYLIPTHYLLINNIFLKLCLSLCVIGIPIFFASACFALRFRCRPATNIALGWNLLGSVTGGLLEFLSMIIGLKSLFLVATLAYLGAFLVREHYQPEKIV
jgi:hypothetical protein